MHRRAFSLLELLILISIVFIMFLIIIAFGRQKRHLPERHTPIGQPQLAYHADPAFDALVGALAAVESSNNPDAVGLDGELGLLQIRPIMVEEVNRLQAITTYTLDDRRSPVKSREMFFIYTYHWADHWADYSPEGAARRWNGGPRGHLNPATLPYWKKVQSVLYPTKD